MGRRSHILLHYYYHSAYMYSDTKCIYILQWLAVYLTFFQINVLNPTNICSRIGIFWGSVGCISLIEFMITKNIVVESNYGETGNCLFVYNNLHVCDRRFPLIFLNYPLNFTITTDPVCY